MHTGANDGLVSTVGKDKNQAICASEMLTTAGSTTTPNEIEKCTRSFQVSSSSPWKGPAYSSALSEKGWGVLLTIKPVIGAMIGSESVHDMCFQFVNSHCNQIS
jgi:hypothetical protein